jgi:photosystem II stability/assembly factor-like uncharacterized protein
MSEDPFVDVSLLAPAVAEPRPEVVARERSRLLAVIEADRVRRVVAMALAPRSQPSRRSQLSKPRRWIVAATVIAAAVGLLAGGLPNLLGSGSGMPSGRLHRFTTALQSPRPVTVEIAHATPTKGSGWSLVSFIEPVGWQQNLNGPAHAGVLTCPSDTTCYLETDGTASASGPPDMDGVLVTADGGTSWSVLALPQYVAFTAALTCSGALTCSAPAFVDDQPAIVSTVNGGDAWQVVPLPTGMDPIGWLSCTSATSCDGLTAPLTPANSGFGLNLEFGNTSGGEINGIASLPDEVFVSTTNGGATWSSAPLPTRDAVSTLSCPNTTDCVIYGMTIPLEIGNNPDFFVLRTSDGGATWTTGTLPPDFGGRFDSIDCATASSCTLVGETVAASDEPVFQPTGAVAVSVDGGATWQSASVDVPGGQFSDLSCPSASTCWIAGSEAVPLVIGTVHNYDQSVLLGTTDGGATWQTVTFSVPADAPNFDDQSYLTLGSVSCGSTSSCMAIGATALGSPTAPIYDLHSGGS